MIYIGSALLCNVVLSIMCQVLDRYRNVSLIYNRLSNYMFLTRFRARLLVVPNKLFRINKKMLNICKLIS